MALQLFFVFKWKQIETIPFDENYIAQTKVAIIIPVRNEAKNIRYLLDAIIQQNYPKSLLEIIVVDDFSTDNTKDLAEQSLKDQEVSFKVLELKNFLSSTTNAYKKMAITVGVENTNQELIITTDADCVMQENWLKSIVQFYETSNANLIASPVVLYNQQSSNFFSRFQILDFCGMQLITAACLKSEIFNMANGANLTYKRTAFLKVNGYAEIDQKASGDDMLLVYKIAQLDSAKVFFNKSMYSLARTPIVSSFNEFLQQRFRWTSKATDYQDKRMTIMLGLVLLFCVSLVVNILTTLGYLFYYKLFPDRTFIGYLNFLTVFFFLFLSLGQFLFKSISDYILLYYASSFFKEKRQLKFFMLSELLHIVYIVYVGILGNFVQYKWKGRSLK